MSDKVKKISELEAERAKLQDRIGQIDAELSKRRTELADDRAKEGGPKYFLEVN